MSSAKRVANGELPDVAKQVYTHPQGTIDWVGMANITTPVAIADAECLHEQSATVQIYVDLANPRAKGIHMSRLYKRAGRFNSDKPLTPQGLIYFLDDLRATHGEDSTQAFVEYKVDVALERPALVSENIGWQNYPVVITGKRQGSQVWVELELVIHYSSTCPASAALSRQAIQAKFETDFDSGTVSVADVSKWLSSADGVVATPHGQRSQARVKVALDAVADHFPIVSMIDDVERVLQTPVQTAVKRADEQEFAIRNGQNPMFCEDAIRKITQLLDGNLDVLDYFVRVEHYESLHAHDAVSIAVKGVPGGMEPIP